MNNAPTFDDGLAYERFMGRWSRAIGETFLDWMKPQPGARWLDVGCGGGAFSELIVARCSPAAVCAVDPAQAQINYARQQSVGMRVEFRVGNAEELPYPEASFDIVASALVINFIPDRPKALREMRRVARSGGLIGGYVWDFAGERSVMSPMRRALQAIGAAPPPSTGAEDSNLERLEALFRNAGLEDLSTKTIDIPVTYSNFDDFWQAQTPGFNPLTHVIAALRQQDRENLVERVKETVGVADGSIGYAARANAVVGYAP